MDKAEGNFNTLLSIMMDKWAEYQQRNRRLYVISFPLSTQHFQFT